MRRKILKIFDSYRICLFYILMVSFWQPGGLHRPTQMQGQTENVQARVMFAQQHSLRPMSRDVRPAQFAGAQKYVCSNIFDKNMMHLLKCVGLFNHAAKEYRSVFFPSCLPLPTAWLTGWPAVKGAFVSAYWRKANQILWLVCLKEENGAPGMPSAAKMCRLSDFWGSLCLLWPFPKLCRR